MPELADADALLESLRADLQAQMAALNDLHHPVYGGSAKRIAELESRIAELRAAISERRAIVAQRSPAG
jgi:peptidoglycan hydrolase CwlO-like protein